MMLMPHHDGLGALKDDWDFFVRSAVQPRLIRDTSPQALVMNGVRYAGNLLINQITRLASAEVICSYISLVLVFLTYCTADCRTSSVSPVSGCSACRIERPERPRQPGLSRSEYPIRHLHYDILHLGWPYGQVWFVKVTSSACHAFKSSGSVRWMGPKAWAAGNLDGLQSH